MNPGRVWSLFVALSEPSPLTSKSLGGLFVSGETVGLLGCAVFQDILKPISVPCKFLQSDQLCIVNVMEAILKTNILIVATLWEYQVRQSNGIVESQNSAKMEVSKISAANQD